MAATSTPTRYEQLMTAARKTNAKRDASERKAGFAAESDLHPFVQVRTAMMAIEAGITTEDWSNIAEAQAILEVAMQKIRVATKDALDRMSYEWLSTSAADLVMAIDAELKAGTEPAGIRFIVQRHVGPDRDGLALRCEQAARYLQSQREA